MIGVVGGDQPRDVDQQVARGGLAGKWMDGHSDLLKEARKAKVCSLDSASAGNVGFCRSVFMPVGDLLPTAFVEHFVYWGDSTPAYRLAPSGAMAGAIFSSSDPRMPKLNRRFPGYLTYNGVGAIMAQNDNDGVTMQQAGMPKEAQCYT